MKYFRKPALPGMVLAGVMACTAFGVMAQGSAPAATPGAAAPQRSDHGHMDPARMKAMVDKRLADLKAKLKITPAQEGAWSAYAAAMQPPTDMGQRPSHAEFDKLTTPQRIDKMREMRARREAEMDKRGDATKTFYTALTPEQQKVFDANAMRHHPPMERGMHREGKPAGAPAQKS